MRVVPLLTGLVLLGFTPAKADEHEECKQQIKRLQERLDLLEAKFEILSVSAEAPKPVADSGTPGVRAQALTLASPQQRREVTPPELIPEIGKIGAQVGLILSGSSNPFHLNGGQDIAGFIDLPLFEPQVIRGKISYEIRVGLSQARTKFPTTSNVAQVANLAALTALNPSGGSQNLVDSITGTGAAPFPVTSLTETRSKLLQVVPFSLKYSSTALDKWRLRPYALLGFGTYVTIHRQTQLNGGVRSDAALPASVLALVNQIFGGTAPFGGALVAGQLTQSPELTSRGLPIGAGNIDFGLHAGGGFEFRLNRNLSLGFDGRYNRLSGGQILGTYGTRVGFHF